VHWLTSADDLSPNYSASKSVEPVRQSAKIILAGRKNWDKIAQNRAKATQNGSAWP